MKNKIMDFVKQNGFLLFLFICVCAVAAGTIYVSTTDLREARDDTKDDELVILEEIENEETTDLPELEDIEVSSIDEETAEEEVVEEEVVEEVINEEELSEVAVESDVAIGQETADGEIEFVDDYEEENEDDTDLVTKEQKASSLPVDGEVITEFSNDKLVYSSTLDEWRHHGGIDIKAPVGTDVIAPLSGTVKEVIEDDLWGITIIIDHGNGLETKYSNLGTKEMVKPGISVNAGDIISTVGGTAKIEMKTEPHLHYEASKNGKIIDPRSITN